MKTIEQHIDRIAAERDHVSLNAQLEEIDYELGMRRKVYPSQVYMRKMRQSIADEHMRRMCAVRETLAKLLEEKDPDT